MRNAECGMRNAECGMQNAEFGITAAMAGELRRCAPPRLPLRRELDFVAASRNKRLRER